MVPDSSAALRARITQLGALVGDVLKSHARPGTYERVETLRALTRSRRANPAAGDAEIERFVADLAAVDAIDVIRAFNTYFQMVNVAEELHREHRRRERALHAEPPLRGSLETLSAEALAALARIEIRLVFTAHPTDVARRTTTEKLTLIAQLLRQLDERVLTDEEERALLRQVRAQIVLLWQTNELYATAPTVQDEVRNLIARFRESIFTEATLLFERIDERADAAVPTFLSFGSWIAGDRDGNSNVAPDAILDAHEQGRAFVLDRYVAAVEDLQSRLSQDVQRGRASAELLTSIERDTEELGDVRYAIGPRQVAEPYRRKLAFVHRRLRRAMADAADGYRESTALLADLALIEASVHAGSGDDAARPIRRLMRAVRIFGFRLYALEWRQHRNRVSSALDEIVAIIEPGAARLSERSEAERERWFARELSAARPLIPADAPFTAETADVIASLHAVARLRDRRGGDAVASLILAGTEEPHDILALFVLARATGTLRAGALQIVPLLESPTALAAAVPLCDALLRVPAFRRHLAACGDLFEIMLGYSDTTKVSGTIKSAWGLYRAQIGLTEMAAAHGVALRFFHGRGGSAGRGAADAREAIAAQPPAARSGRFKVTEQGEVIGARYGLPSLARRNLELAVTSVVNGLDSPADAMTPARNDVFDRFAAAAQAAYVQLVDDPQFLTFFAQCTPVDEIGQMQISSRPGKRGQRSTIDDLRAIPWSFGWAQARAMLPGWYGFGAAIAACSADLDELRAMAAEVSFFRELLRSIERALAVADMAIFRRYAADLVPDIDLRERFVTVIVAEFAATRTALLQILGRERLLEHDATLERSIELRNPYVDAISFLQLRLLRDVRAQPDAEPHLRDAIRLSINGIAAGLRVTG
jgi:phosphoenolpyruvate carboxylase